MWPRSTQGSNHICMLGRARASAGCKFANFGGGSVPVLLYGGSASVSLERCTFVRNSGPTAADGARSGLVVLSGSGGGFVRLEGCTFESNAVDYVAVDDSDIASGRIFADNAEVCVCRSPCS